MTTKERVKELLDYNPETGLFTWKVDRGSQKVKGKVAGCCVKNHSGKSYITIQFDRKVRKAHRLAWLVMTGSEPVQIDHINGDGTDNRFSNLRNATSTDNARNHRMSKKNTSGVNGVAMYVRPSGSVAWQGRITVDRKVKTKLFDKKEDAIQWRMDMEVVFGYHENHGQVRPL